MPPPPSAARTSAPCSPAAPVVLVEDDAANHRPASVSPHACGRPPQPAPPASGFRPQSGLSPPACEPDAPSDLPEPPAGPRSHWSRRPIGRPFCRLLPPGPPSLAIGGSFAHSTHAPHEGNGIALTSVIYTSALIRPFRCTLRSNVVGAGALCWSCRVCRSRIG